MVQVTSTFECSLVRHVSFFLKQICDIITRVLMPLKVSPANTLLVGHFSQGNERVRHFV